MYALSANHGTEAQDLERNMGSQQRRVARDIAVRQHFNNITATDLES